MIAHVDMDAFFVSVELVKRPDLRGRPVVVATSTDPRSRGVVMAANYEARRFGVRSALPLVTAHRLCPAAVILPCDIALYRRASNAVIEVLRRYSDTIEVAGLDEAYLDLSGSPVPVTRARELKRAVLARTRLVCSVGLAPNKLLAKIASDLDKPDGFCELHPEGMLDAVGQRSARVIPGVGPRTEERLRALGIRTVRELALADRSALAGAFGPRLGAELRDRGNGIDSRPIVSERVRKSESRETTFGEDVTDRAILAATLNRLAGSLCESLRREGREGRTVTLKIRLRPFRTYTRSRKLAAPTCDPEVIGGVAFDLLGGFDPAEPVRLLGVGISGLSPMDERADSAATAEGGAAESLSLEPD